MPATPLVCFVDTQVISYGFKGQAPVDLWRTHISSVVASEFLRVYDEAPRKLVRARWRFLVDHEITCAPLNPRVTELTGNLLHAFVKQYEPKSNFRNTLNDVIILATAKAAGATLITRDTLLARFAGSIRELSQTFIEVKFDSVSRERRPATAESKGFVNRGWDIRFRRWGNRPE